jgi:hypothetical protein
MRDCRRAQGRGLQRLQSALSQTARYRDRSKGSDVREESDRIMMCATLRCSDDDRAPGFDSLWLELAQFEWNLARSCQLPAASFHVICSLPADPELALQASVFPQLMSKLCPVK